MITYKKLINAPAVILRVSIAEGTRKKARDNQKGRSTYLGRAKTCFVVVAL